MSAAETSVGDDRRSHHFHFGNAIPDFRPSISRAHRILLYFLLAVLALAVWGYLFERAQRKQRNVFTRWPIPTVWLRDVDPVFQQQALGPSRETEVSLVGGANVMHVPGGTSDTEAWILAVLAKQSKLMFEFGTCTGRTAYSWARNSPSDAKIVTLTLSPDEISTYHREAGDTRSATERALKESTFESFYYSDTAVGGKVVQLFGDSKALDESPWVGQCDLVFVDGSHARSYVESDSRKALRLVKPGGLVLWHDYRGAYRLKGVYDALNALAKELPLVHIHATSFIAYRRPLANS